MNKLVKSVRATGAPGVVGAFEPEDPKAEGLAMRQVAAHWLGTDTSQSLQRMLCRLIAAGKAQPSFLVSHELPLERAPDAYEHFDAREYGWTKEVLKPAA
jgi:glutathione-independent formaldehyde dehydrogenase